MKIFIDPGHNHSGWDTGAAGNGLKEQDITFAIALRLKELLERMGHSVKLSRNSITDNVGFSLLSSLRQRCAMSNQWGADLFVSIHCNAGGGTGAETYVYSKESKAYSVATNVQSALTAAVGLVNRGVKLRPSLAVLSGTSAPALLVETGFIDNAADADKLKNRQEDYAAALYMGLTGQTPPKTEEEKPMAKYDYIGTTHVVTCDPLTLGVYQADAPAHTIGVSNFVNGGYFMNQDNGTTFAQGHLADQGRVLSNYMTHDKPVTTLCVYWDGRVEIKPVSDLTGEENLKTAISGASLTGWQNEGFSGAFSDIARSTTRTYVGYRKADNKIVICVRPDTDMARARQTFANLGVDCGLTLDGGGSSCMRVGGAWKVKTTRQINNILMWE